jgi:hypothetical protein
MNQLLRDECGMRRSAAKEVADYVPVAKAKQFTSLADKLGAIAEAANDD